MRTWTSASTAAVSNETTASSDTSNLVRRCPKRCVNTCSRKLTEHLGPEPDTLVTSKNTSNLAPKHGPTHNHVSLSWKSAPRQISPWLCHSQLEFSPDATPTYAVSGGFLGGARIRSGGFCSRFRGSAASF